LLSTAGGNLGAGLWIKNVVILVTMGFGNTLELRNFNVYFIPTESTILKVLAQHVSTVTASIIRSTTVV
jgi:hypothetical protein